jgi:apolipoprotein N-acyltransferase
VTQVALHLVLALASAQALLLVFPPFDLPFLAPVALAPLLVAAAREGCWWRRFLMGQLAGAVFWGGMCHWIRQTLEFHGGLTGPLSWLALVLFALVKGLHLGVYTWLSGYFLNRWWAIPAAGALWVGIERTHGPLGFAWLTLGDAGTDMTVPLRLAPLVGVYGLSFVFAAMSAAVSLVAMRRPRSHLAAVVLLPGLFLLPKLPAELPGARHIAAIQPNLREDTPPDVGRMAAASMVASVTRPALIVWPEGPAGFYWDQDPALRDILTTLARDAAIPLLFGGVTDGADGAPLNSAILVDGFGQERGRYSKTFLVPFGEFVPPLFDWIGKVSTEAGDFHPGDGPRALQLDDIRAGAFICYEAAFPHLVRQFPALGADVLVNLSNDGWFGRSSARAQHLRLARMRAAENRRWLLRVTNDGITASIDPAGRVVAQLTPFRESSGKLPFSAIPQQTAYTRNGDWFAWSCLVAGLVATLAGAAPWRPAGTAPGGKS